VPAIKNQQPATLTQASAIKHQPHDFFLQEQEENALFPPARQNKALFFCATDYFPCRKLQTKNHHSALCASG
jgi:hypothetical protein